ncbi:MAG TPA: TerC/Alx family metal homeostasis membrane protein [Kineosporiaceae bacterium]
MSIAGPTLWGATLLLVGLLLAVDFLITRRPHQVSLREAAVWSGVYLSLPLAFGTWVWWRHGAGPGSEFLAGYIVEKSLSVDNLFVFMLLLTSFAVPTGLRQRVLLFGIVGALGLRGAAIAVGAVALETFSLTFLVFGAILLLTAVTVLRDARRGHREVDVTAMLSVRLLRRVLPVSDRYHGTRLTVRDGAGRRALTPLALAVGAVLATDIVFAVDSVPAVFGVTEDPYLVFATNAFALLGLRALYFLLSRLLDRLIHLGYGLATILGFIGVKLVLHWAQLTWPAVPEVPTAVSLGVIGAVLATVTATSLVATGRRERAAREPELTSR